MITTQIVANTYIRGQNYLFPEVNLSFSGLASGRCRHVHVAQQMTSIKRKVSIATESDKGPSHLVFDGAEQEVTQAPKRNGPFLNGLPQSQSSQSRYGKGINELGRRFVMSQSTTSDARERIPRSPCARHLEFAKISGSRRKCYFSSNSDTRRQRGEKKMVSPKVKHKKSSSLRFQEKSLYQSFFGENAGEDVCSKFLNPSQNPMQETRAEHRSEIVSSPYNPDNATTRCYALYRGMLKQ